MSRLIDADALKEWIDEYVSVFKKSDTREIKGYIEHQPTIDAVSVVRCKECRYWEKSQYYTEFMVCTYVTGATFTRQHDDFCSRGEREGE